MKIGLLPLYCTLQSEIYLLVDLEALHISVALQATTPPLIGCRPCCCRKSYTVGCKSSVCISPEAVWPCCRWSTPRRLSVTIGFRMDYGPEQSRFERSISSFPSWLPFCPSILLHKGRSLRAAFSPAPPRLAVCVLRTWLQAVNQVLPRPPPPARKSNDTSSASLPN
ncbi:hypothetical protein M430DRAFT_167994 [Amorphotheca resinae ATCC 22711]|jgi:hypothetical protein|uniref:Uncharacterized protein n=1 Tax=Amorphotheca resinae ATCC 22711 TaxID=857342 RepID=A0A2T3AU90_AMORE|nr:hypothetical protein M430DRAFT_167994 [Amorphotheca resinae ATCC 22711]PSS12202.1 hypothetical protein M430DRAFT_167994 [Amorphotheca resinae ATCC 22711]